MKTVSILFFLSLILPLPAQTQTILAADDVPIPEKLGISVPAQITDDIALLNTLS